MRFRMILAALILVTCSFQVIQTKHAVPEPDETIEHPLRISEPSDPMLSQQQAVAEEIIPHTEPASEETEEILGESEALSVPESAEEEIPPEETITPVAEAEEPSSAPAPPAALPRQRVVDGQKEIWVPGFGWIPDEGGGGTECTIIGSDGDINKMVGHM